MVRKLIERATTIMDKWKFKAPRLWGLDRSIFSAGAILFTWPMINFLSTDEVETTWTILTKRY